MSKILIATIYNHYSIVSTVHTFTIDKLIILSDTEPNETMTKSINLIQETFGKSIDIQVKKIELYNIIKVAKDVVYIIDNIPEKDSIYIDITSGRKPKSLGLLFGSYARAKRIKKIVYVTEDSNEIITLPKMFFDLNPTEYTVMKMINDEPYITTNQVADRMKLSRAIIYRYIQKMQTIDAVNKRNSQLILTDFGKIMLL
jgi:CRISPR-associated protein Csa3